MVLQDTLGIAPRSGITALLGETGRPLAQQDGVIRRLGNGRVQGREGIFLFGLRGERRDGRRRYRQGRLDLEWRREIRALQIGGGRNRAPRGEGFGFLDKLRRHPRPLLSRLPVCITLAGPPDTSL